MMKYLTAKEFQEGGYLQEANRLFFHPLGLALAVYTDDPESTTLKVEIWDERDDPEGWFFGKGEINVKKAVKVGEERVSKLATRAGLLDHGYYSDFAEIQRVDELPGDLNE